MKKSAKAAIYDFSISFEFRVQIQSVFNIKINRSLTNTLLF